MAILDFTDVKKSDRGKEGREGGDQARFFMWIILREGLKKSLQLQTLSEQGGGSENYPMCLNPISEFLI